VVLSITLDRRTFDVFLEDALEEGVPVEVFVARHLTLPLSLRLCRSE
jgi:hypothetical protein